MGGSSPGPVEFSPQFEALRNALAGTLTQQVGQTQPQFPGQLFAGTSPANQTAFSLLADLSGGQPALRERVPLEGDTGDSGSSIFPPPTGDEPQQTLAHPDQEQLVQLMVAHGWSESIAQRISGEMLSGQLLIVDGNFAEGGGVPVSAQDVFNNLSDAGSVVPGSTFTATETSVQALSEDDIQKFHTPFGDPGDEDDPDVDPDPEPFIGQSAGQPFIPPGFPETGTTDGIPNASGLNPLVNVAQGIGNQNTLVSQLLQQLGRSTPEQFGVTSARNLIGSLGTNLLQSAGPTGPGAQATDTFGRLTQDLGSTPSLFQKGEQTLEGILGTGNPVTIGPSFEAGKALLEQNVNDQVAQVSESFSARGNRFSEPLARAIGDTRRRGALDINNLLANFTRESGENAAQRQQQGVTQAQNLGAVQGLFPGQVASQAFPFLNLSGQLPIQQAGAGQNLLDPLLGFEQFGAQAPQERARTVSEVGTQIPQAAGDFLSQLINQNLLAGGIQTQQRQGDIATSFSEFQNRQPFSNPAFNAALGFSTGFPPISGGTAGLGGPALQAGGGIGAAIIPLLMAKSSMKYKENVVPIEPGIALEYAEGIQLVEFDYIDLDKKRHIGIILEDEDPVFATEDGTHIDVDVVGILLGAIQELTRRVKELEGK